MYSDEFPMAYFITWTTYGTWLPGDERGWLEKGSPVIQPPDPVLRAAAQAAMTQERVVLTQAQRDLVDQVIAKHCQVRFVPSSRPGVADDCRSSPASRVMAKTE